MDKNHHHLERPHESVTKEYNSEQIDSALRIYGVDDLEKSKAFSIASDQEIENAWASVSLEELRGMEIRGLHPDDKKKSLAEEEKKLETKKKEEEQLKLLPARKIKLARGKKGKQRAKTSKPSTPSPPPPNQLGRDTDKTPRASGSSKSLVIILFVSHSNILSKILPIRDRKLALHLPVPLLLRTVT